MRAGRIADAANLYAEACQLDPTDEASCANADQLRDSLVADAVTVGDRPCRTGDLPACASAMADARTVAPDDSRVVELLGAAGVAHVGQCTRDPASALPQRLAQLACARTGRDHIGLPAAYAVRLDQLGRQIATELDDHAAQVQDVGARAVWRELAACRARPRLPTPTPRATR